MADSLRAGLAAALLLASGCGSYGEFALSPPAGEPRQGRFTFEQEALPVLERGPAGRWDSADVLNPSIVRHVNQYFNFYSGFDGKTWHTGLAISPDGVGWLRRGKLLSPGPNSWESGYIAANGSALWHEGEWFYWYQAGPRNANRIGLARSRDLASWSRVAQPVLPAGPRGSWDEVSIGDPYVFRRDGFFFMYYLGMDRARRQRLGIARSSDGVRWTKLRSNPVLEPGEPGEFDDNGLGEPAVWESHGFYWMIYTGRDRSEIRRLGMAQSRDGVRWNKRRDLVFSGEAAWNRTVLCDPDVEVLGDRIRVWFGGGDRPSPDENLNGAIGIGMLRFQDASLTK